MTPTNFEVNMYKLNFSNCGKESDSSAVGIPKG